MAYVQFPAVDVVTSVGKLRVAVSWPLHVFITGDEGVKVNGVGYSASCHLYPDAGAEGGWDVKNSHDLYGSRRSWSGHSYNKAQMTPAARRQFKRVCVGAVSALLKLRPELPRQAWEANREKAIADYADQIRQAEAELRNLRIAAALIDDEKFPG